MSDLIARLEAATEGSRELDLEFHKALGLCPVDAQEYLDDEWMTGCPPFTDGGPLPPYFTSGGIPAELLEAVGTGTWSLSGPWISEASGNKKFYRAKLQEVDEVRAATPALALTIAALKAREEKGDDV